MRVNTLPNGLVSVIEISGRFDAHVAPEFEKWLDENLPSTSVYLIVDLEKVNFIDSSALAILVRGMKRYREKGGDLSLCNLQQPVHIIFELTRMDFAFNIHDSVAKAISATRK